MGINGSFEICTNNTNGNAGACYGDSGGPQVRMVDVRWNLIGATSRSGNGSAVCATGPSIQPPQRGHFRGAAHRRPHRVPALEKLAHQGWRRTRCRP